METRSDKRADFGPAAIVDDSLRQFADEIDPPVLKIGQGDYTREWPRQLCPCGNPVAPARVVCYECLADGCSEDGSLLRGLARGFAFSAVLWGVIILLIRWLL
ncbi:MAG: hypothetical protein IT450_04990 [Phycisphaerales bacterium]|nr:hypothetical protein [Phycisphaerales bacterium]